MVSMKTILPILLLTMCVYGVSMAAVHEVGESGGWTSMGHTDYQGWAATHNFHVGDTLVFHYPNQCHNVKEVSLHNYEICNGTSPVATYNSGSDSILLQTSGHFYFICGFPGHCFAGQKLEIFVTPISSTPTPSPSIPLSPLSLSASSSSTITNSPTKLSLLLCFLHFISVLFIIY